MTQPHQISSEQDSCSGFATTRRSGQRVRLVFRWLLRGTMLATIIVMAYWVVASDRYVSESIILIQNTEKLAAPSLDLTSLIGVGGGANRPDQLLMREHLLSVDMLLNLDAQLHLRTHFSSTQQDIFSRMWSEDVPLEWFHEHFLSRLSVHFDEISGVLRIRAEDYDPQMAQRIAALLVQNGEAYMNKLSHELAQAQVDFLEQQVIGAYDAVLSASQTLLDYQNKKGLASPTATAESIIAIIAGLEAQRTEMQTQMSALPENLVKKHPAKIRLQQALAAVESQIEQESARLASTEGNTLNTLIFEQQRLQMDVDFKRDVYKTALVALEKGRMDASRTMKLVSVLQTPVFPEYPLEPRRMYNILTTLIVGMLLLGIAKLLESVILDHVD